MWLYKKKVRFTLVLPQLGGDIAVSSIVRDDDGQDVTDVRGWLG